MNKRLILLLLSTICANMLLRAQGKQATQDQAYTLIQSVMHRYDCYRSFLSAATGNPAQQGYKYPSGLSSFYIKGDIKASKYPVFYQQGTGHKGLLFEAQSYLKRKKNTHLWGAAHYNVQHKKNLSWISSADVEILYPYFLADTLGGDLRAEEYAFQGGYSKQWVKWSIGGEVNYRASQEYRTEDPRPRNIVSDLNIKAGGAFLLSDSYNIGLTIKYGAYQQRGDVTFYKETGGISELQMDGLGSHYERFDGTKSDLCYEMSTVQTSLNLLPINKKGFDLSITYSHTVLERIMYGLNQAPINSYYKHSLPVRLAYVKDGTSTFFSAGIMGEYSHKQGRNNIISESTKGEYLPVGHLPMYAEESMHSSVFASYASKGKSVTWDIAPRIGIRHLSMEYLYPHRKLLLGNLNTHMSSGITLHKNKYILRSEIGVMYDHCFRHTLSVPIGLLKPFENRYLHTTFGRISSNQWAISCSESFHLQLSKNLILYTTLFVQGRFYSDKNRSCSSSLSFGINF
ncbi:DUF6850 family outer membrane beta-barrel protein [Porphyromonas pogonae]|uniref:DUF6850 family outer membrane beta-barrel protein n=1 Tax=Porphyromonas pogonae TaxID=867595 RepID=UPI002E7A6F4A|nr:DUF6850 family outer membrane beta-barrel protein [Porphyromonas pogonae]